MSVCSHETNENDYWRLFCSSVKDVFCTITGVTFFWRNWTVAFYFYLLIFIHVKTKREDTSLLVSNIFPNYFFIKMGLIWFVILVITGNKGSVQDRGSVACFIRTSCFTVYKHDSHDLIGDCQLSFVSF